MKKNQSQLSKKFKLLLIVYKMVSKKRKALKYEDMIVKAFKEYPSDFQLRGYPQYPDTGDSSQRPLYTLRKEGLIQVHNKFISLTEKGITLANKLKNIKSNVSKKPSGRLSRDITSEIERIRNTEAFQLFALGQKEKAVDSDFFAYLGTTVRTERTDFRARMRTIHDVIEAIKMNDEYKVFVDLHNYLFQRFNETIKKKLLLGYPRRNA